MTYAHTITYTTIDADGNTRETTMRHYSRRPSLTPRGALRVVRGYHPAASAVSRVQSVPCGG